MLAAQQLAEFAGYTLGRNSPHGGGKLSGCGGGSRINGKAKNRRKAQSPQDAQGILREAPVGVTNTGYPPFEDSCLARKRVGQPVHRMVGHGIYCKITPTQIFC